MVKLLAKSVAALAVAGTLLTPTSALAVGYEDSLDDCNYPKLFDLMVMRPMSFTTMIVGTVLWVPAFPLALATSAEDSGAVTHALIGASWDFTFNRNLGECTGVTLSY